MKKMLAAAALVLGMGAAHADDSKTLYFYNWTEYVPPGLLEQFSGDMDQAESTLEDCYHGQFASLADYMEELTTESVTIPEALRPVLVLRARAMREWLGAFCAEAEGKKAEGAGQ